MKQLKWFLCLFFLSIASAKAQQPVVSKLDSNVIKTLFYAGLRDKLNENYPRAAENFNKILAIDADNAAVHYEIAVLNYRQNKIQEAEQAVKKATSIDANNVWYWKLMGELYKRSGNMDALIGVFNQLIRLSPDNDAYYFDRSNAWLLSGKEELAMKGYAELEQKFGPSEELNQARARVEQGRSGAKPAKKEAAVSNATEAQKPALDPNDPKVMAGMAEELYKKGELNAALEQYRKVLKQTDQLYGVWEQTLNIQTILGLYKEVITTADEALSVYPNQAILYYFIAFAQQQETKYEEALGNIKTALSLDAENPVYQECYGDILFLKGNVEQALVQWKKVKAVGGGSDKLKKKIDERKYIK
ncbi:tetratricopeptide repeat protein [Pedobacter sp. GR22-6]|uniref:tetratricopeptide repeat protein n=1 Tax=Pedobacter sp. GR22-6 TaxID=3127957 RepID=UPI00307D03CD